MPGVNLDAGADVAAGGVAARGGDPVIDIRGLRMAYGSVEAVRGIDLMVRRGEVFAFLGPNGAGKTTTVEILEGFRRRTAGDVRVLGEDPGGAGGAWRARLGVVLQESKPEAELKVRECLALYAGYYPAPRPVGEILELVGLADRGEALCRTLSGGQLRRLDVAVALVGDPELIFLDEPTTGFDPSARRAAWDVIAGLRHLGKTILLTTHYMDEAEYLADRIAVIAGGRIVAEGTPAGLGGRDGADAVISFRLPAGLTPVDLPPAIRAAPRDESGRIDLRSGRPLPILAELTSWAMARGLDLPDLQVRRPTLEDIYLRLTRGEG
jgi:ABC-2 type transport system ATP-binding protein